MPCCVHDEKRSSDEGSDQRYTVANAVRKFFPSRLFTLEAREQYAHASSFQDLQNKGAELPARCTVA